MDKRLLLDNHDFDVDDILLLLLAYCLIQVLLISTLKVFSRVPKLIDKKGELEFIYR